MNLLGSQTYTIRWRNIFGLYYTSEGYEKSNARLFPKPTAFGILKYESGLD
jgi:hypothetical protein